MEKKFFELLQEAKDLGVLESGSLLIFDEYLKECQNKVKKNEKQIQRLLGQNEQLSLTMGMLANTVQKYVGLQREFDDASEALQEDQPEEPKPLQPEVPSVPEAPPEPKVRKTNIVLKEIKEIPARNQK